MVLIRFLCSCVPVRALGQSLGSRACFVLASIQTPRSRYPTNALSHAQGELRCTGKPGARWIRTKKSYSDFDLKLEFRLRKNGNSGVFIRAPEHGSPWVQGLEIQLLDDYGDKYKNLKPYQFTGSIYAVVPPSRRATKKAGQWQSMRIRCVKTKVQVWVNGKQVIDADLSKYKSRAKQVPGLQRQSGYIGLQDHGDAAAFRRITIREVR